MYFTTKDFKHHCHDDDNDEDDVYLQKASSVSFFFLYLIFKLSKLNKISMIKLKNEPGIRTSDLVSSLNLGTTTLKSVPYYS